MAADLHVRVEFRFSRVWYELGVLCYRVGFDAGDRYCFRKAFQLKVGSGAWSSFGDAIRS